MTDKDREIARELKRRLTDIVDLADFKVFGSRARGDSEEDSDLDVFIEVEQLTKDDKRRIRDIVWDVGFKHSIYISALIFTRHEVEDTPLRSSSVVRNIVEEGVAV